MPLELGAFMAAKKFGTKEQKQKKCLILDRDPHRYLSFISDIRGQDIKSHGNEINRAIRNVRDWLNAEKPARIMLPGHILISRRYHEYLDALPETTRRLGLDHRDLQFNDQQNLISEWININPKK